MIQNIFLGLLQGLTEILPISSSGHLIFASWFFLKNKISLSQIVFLHTATLFALILYFRKDWSKIIKAVFSKEKSYKNCLEKKILLLIIIATLPGAILGKLGENLVEKIFYHPLPVAINMGIFAILFYLIDKFSKKNKDISKINFSQALFIGIIQAFAIFPGISRSGITMAGGLLLGLDRENTVKFSLYLSFPMILGATLLKYNEILKGLFSEHLMPNSLGFFSSFFTGLLAIHFLMKFVKKHSFNLFIVYRFLISVLIIFQFLV